MNDNEEGEFGSSPWLNPKLTIDERGQLFFHHIMAQQAQRDGDIAKQAKTAKPKLKSKKQSSRNLK